MTRLTDWFPGRVRPVHHGVYERQASKYVNYYALWDGMHWFALCKSVDRAAASPFKSALQSDLKWRGLNTRQKSKVKNLSSR